MTNHHYFFSEMASLYTGLIFHTHFKSTRKMVDDKDIGTVCQHDYELGKMGSTILTGANVFSL